MKTNYKVWSFIFILLLCSSNQELFTNVGTFRIPDVPRAVRRFSTFDKDYDRSYMEEHLGSHRSFYNFISNVAYHIEVVDLFLERKLTKNCQNIHEKRDSLIPIDFWDPAKYIIKTFQMREYDEFESSYKYYIQRWENFREFFNNHCGDMGYPYWPGK